MPTVEFEPAQILLFGDDCHGQLVLINGRLAAVVTRLTAESYPEDVRGLWQLEAGFGPCGASARLFGSLHDVKCWTIEAYQSGFQSSWEPLSVEGSLEAA